MTEQNQKKLGATLWALADQLRGAMDADDFRDYSGDQLRKITSLIEAGAIRPVIDKVFAFEKTNDALAYVESGRAKGKVVIRVK